ncbi:MAG TPA: DCC1-like thiol-disulfide oxidoreductase family protein [Candidatus Thermoplasmatota archaeon]|nr:DCC1-like thiol-disulfide oxidoreductase family protein [Candidatus Thermoplasmatota archaeon]
MEPATLIFDGDCGFCTRAARFVEKRDPRGRLTVLAAASPEAAARLDAAGLTETAADTIVLFEGPRVSLRSTAALRVARRLRWPWPLLAALLVVPRPLRDAVYRLVARHRHRLSGQGSSCSR